MDLIMVVTFLLGLGLVAYILVKHFKREQQVVGYDRSKLMLDGFIVACGLLLLIGTFINLLSK